MTTHTELEALKAARTAYHNDHASLNDMVLAGTILPHKRAMVASGDYDVTLGVINAAIERLEHELAAANKTAPKVQMCPKHHVQMTMGRCDECDDWDN